MEFSVVICTYNPVKELLSRVIHSCINQSIPSASFEIIIVDNNSSTPLAQQEYLTHFLKNNSNLKLIVEHEQGLVHARIKGIKQSVAETIVFVDDDNVLEKNYLERLGELIKKHKEVAIWGPGIIELDYINGVPKWIDNYFSGLYQKKNKKETQFGKSIEWTDYYPAGSGLIATKKVLNQYLQDFENGKLTAIGRKGNLMSSAEDSQIIWTAVKMGYSAGTSPVLKLTHIIPGSRTNLAYLIKLNYGISSSYYKALKEMFPEHELKYKRRNALSKVALAGRLLLKANFNPVTCYRLYAVENAWLRGYDDYLNNS